MNLSFRVANIIKTTKKRWRNKNKAETNINNRNKRKCSVISEWKRMCWFDDGSLLLLWEDCYWASKHSTFLLFSSWQQRMLFMFNGSGWFVSFAEREGFFPLPQNDCLPAVLRDSLPQDEFALFPQDECFPEPLLWDTDVTLPHKVNASIRSSPKPWPCQGRVPEVKPRPSSQAKRSAEMKCQLKWNSQAFIETIIDIYETVVERASV